MRHIERTRLLLHVIDITAEDPIADYKTIQAELSAYGRGLAERKQIIAFNKIDAVDKDAIEENIAILSQLTSAPIFSISAVTRAGLDILLQAIWDTL